MWPLSRLRSLAGMPRGERALALEALWTLALVRAGLRLLSFRRLRARIERAGGAQGAADELQARAVRRAVDRAARTVPGSACLAQALTAEVMLRRAGCAVRTSIGVSHGGRPLDAHAWVQSAGVLVTGDAEDLGKYTTLLVFGGETTAAGTSPG